MTFQFPRRYFEIAKLNFKRIQYNNINAVLQSNYFDRFPTDLLKSITNCKFGGTVHFFLSRINLFLVRVRQCFPQRIGKFLTFNALITLARETCNLEHYL